MKGFSGKLIGSAAAVWMLVFLLSSGCNKRVSSYNMDFVGKWRTDVINDTLINESLRCELIIEDKDGIFNNSCKSVCEEQLCDCISTQSGRALVSFDKKSMKIGSSNSLTLSIDQEPYQDANGKWTMKIAGLVYYKQ